MKQFLITTLMFTILTAFADQAGEQIGRRTFGLTRPSDLSAIATMTLIDRQGTRRQRRLEFYSKEAGTTTSTFMKFLEPADVSGTKFLAIDRNGTEEQRIYLPTMRRVRLISSSGKNGRFVNSDILYYDLETRRFEDFDYKYLRDETLEGVDYSVVELTSRDQDSPYARAVVWVSKRDNFLYRMECYDRSSNQLIKRIIIVEVSNTNGIIIPVRTVFDNIKDGTKTLLELSQLRINSGLRDEMFSITNLEN